MDRLRPIAKVRALLAELEADLLQLDLSNNDRDLLYACIVESTNADQVFTTGDIRNNLILREMSDPTMYRSLVSLVEKGMLCLAPGRSRGAYMIVDPFPRPKH